MTWKVKPNFRAIGPRYGRLVPAIKKALLAADGAALRREMDDTGKLLLTIGDERVELGPGEVEVVLEPREGFTAAGSPRVVVVLDTELDDELLREGLARELINRIQAFRKELDLDYVDRIRVRVAGDDEVSRVLSEHGELIARETLAVDLAAGEPGPGMEVREVDLAGHAVRLGVART